MTNRGFPDSSRPAWTWHGRPLPEAALGEFGTMTPKDRRAVIPIERIRGPVFLLCGEQDQLWPSCGYAGAMNRELRRHPQTWVREPGAGHLVGSVVPGLPMGSGTMSFGLSV